MQLTPNFSDWEFEVSQEAVRRGIDNRVPESLEGNRFMLACRLQILRNELSAHYKRDVGITITSGYRCPKLNRAIKGSKKSHHMKVAAADIRAQGITPKELFEFIRNSHGFVVDQCILEFDSWVHLSIGLDIHPRGQFLKATKRRNILGRLKTHYEEVV